MKGILALLVVGFAAAASAGNGCPQQQAEDWSIELLLPHPLCNKFYKCTYGVPVEQNCPVNLNYNIETEQCDYVENVDCTGRIAEVESKPEVEKPESPKPEDNGNDNAESEEAGKEEESNNKPDVEGNSCPSDWSVERLLPHPDCRKFYKCAYGKPVALSCQPNLYYNIEKEQCDYSENVDCGDRINGAEAAPEGDNDNNQNGGDSNSGESDSSDSQDSASSSEEQENNNNGQEGPADSCPSDWSVERLLPHPDCRKFYKCTYGKPVALSCPLNLYYNIEKELCDYSENVDCGDRIKGQDSDSAESQGPDGGNDGDNEEDETVAEIEFLPNRCPVDENIHWLIPGENCNEFYYCINGEKQIRVCNAGQEFNPVLQVCDWAASAGCTKSANKHAATRRKVLGY